MNFNVVEYLESLGPVRGAELSLFFRNLHPQQKDISEPLKLLLYRDLYLPNIDEIYELFNYHFEKLSEQFSLVYSFESYDAEDLDIMVNHFIEMIKILQAVIMSSIDQQTNEKTIFDMINMLKDSSDGIIDYVIGMDETMWPDEIKMQHFENASRKTTDCKRQLSLIIKAIELIPKKDNNMLGLEQNMLGLDLSFSGAIISQLNNVIENLSF